MSTEREAHQTSASIGGDFALDWSSLITGPTSASLFATGRDALLAIVDRLTQTHGVWLIPEFICPIVPRTLQARGLRVEPYDLRTPWNPDLHALEARLPRAAAIVVAFHLGFRPDPNLWALLSRHRIAVVEDRCQWVGPIPGSHEIKGDYAIGSFRKWLPTPDGAYAVARSGLRLEPGTETVRGMVAARLAAGVVKHLRQSTRDLSADATLERAHVELFQYGEELAGQPTAPRRASGLGEAAVAQADVDAIVRQRRTNQAWLGERLAAARSVALWEPEPGAVRTTHEALLALPILSPRRDEVRRRLAERQIYCAVHWKDGDWAGRGGLAAQWASQALSLPIDQRYSPADLERVIEALE